MKGLNGATLRMWVIRNGSGPLTVKATPSSSTSLSSSSVKTAYVNLRVVPGCKLARSAGEGFAAVLLLENPVGENMLTYSQMEKEVCKYNQFFSMKPFTNCVAC